MTVCGSCALITPGHCASSLAIHRLGQEGYQVGPPGRVDNRHPQGHYDWMHMLRPQIDKNWDAYVHAIESIDGPFAFKLQSGIIYWGVDALLALPEPLKVVVLDRKDWQQVRRRIGPGAEQWIWEYQCALSRVMYWTGSKDIRVEFWTKEELCAST